jgi:hypothetical protein
MPWRHREVNNFKTNSGGNAHLSEAELHVLKARLEGGILNKVRYGEYRRPLLTGFVYDEIGNVGLDPAAQIRDTPPIPSPPPLSL